MTDAEREAIVRETERHWGFHWAEPEDITASRTQVRYALRLAIPADSVVVKREDLLAAMQEATCGGAEECVDWAATVERLAAALSGESE